MDFSDVMKNEQFLESYNYFMDLYLWGDNSAENIKFEVLNRINKLQKTGDYYEANNKLYGLYYALYKTGQEDCELKKRLINLIETSQDLKDLEIFAQSNKFNNRRLENLNLLLSAINSPVKGVIRRKKLIEKSPLFKKGDIVQVRLDSCFVSIVVVFAKKSSNRYKTEPMNGCFLIPSFEAKYSRKKVFTNKSDWTFKNRNVPGKECWVIPSITAFYSDKIHFKKVNYEIVDTIQFTDELVSQIIDFDSYSIKMNTHADEWLNSMCKPRTLEDYGQNVYSMVKREIYSLDEYFRYFGFELDY